MICPHCFEHLDQFPIELTPASMQVMIDYHLKDKQCLANIRESTDKDKMHMIEMTLRQAQLMMESLHPNFNSVPNAERFVVSCLKANEALRQMQRGNQETVEKYWREE